MKKSAFILFGLMVVSSMASANTRDCLGRPCQGPEISTIAITQLPTISTQATFDGATDLLQNDIMQVQGEAILALETGIVSPELQSVVERIRLEMDIQGMRSMTDMQIVEMIVTGEK